MLVNNIQPRFSRLVVQDWRQFYEIEIDFHPKLTILTGANATGKSTLLGILARHFNWQRAYSSTPRRRRQRSDGWTSVDRRRAERILRQGDWDEVGNLSYSNETSTPINVPSGDTANQARVQYDLLMPHQQPVAGAFITSHRPVSGNYSQVTSIPTSFGDPTLLSEQYTNEVRTQWAGGWTGKTPQLVLKESLIAAAAFGGEGNEYLDFNAQAHEVWTGFQKILHAVMPQSARFLRLRVRVPDVIIETESGDFVLDDASGGLAAVIEVAWQIFLRSHTHPQFTVLLDEPENHLHPSLQREIMPSLLLAFPQVQFIVATHSPFVVTATPDSAVYALDYNSEHLVYSRQLDYANKSASADETLRRVLGMESTMPSWAERKFAEIVSRHATVGLSEEGLLALRNELQEFGLESEFPDAVVQISESGPVDESTGESL